MIVESSSRPVVVTVLSCSKLLGLLKTWHEKGIFVLDHDMNCQSHIINGSNLEYKVLQRYKFWYGCSWFFSIWREFLFKHFAGRKKKKYESFFDIINWWNDLLQNLTTNFFGISNLDWLDVSMRYIDANYIKMPIKIVSVKVRSFRLKRFTIFKANNSHTI